MGILSSLIRSIFGRGFGKGFGFDRGFSFGRGFVRGYNPILHEINRQNRRDYYRNDYLKSEAWQRKRYLVFKRDNGKCVYCGEIATQVHHKRYAKNIGKEPIDWLVSICRNCHESKH